jgi:hypothetical protein
MRHDDIVSWSRRANRFLKENLGGEWSASYEDDPAWMGEWEVHIGVGTGVFGKRNPIGYASHTDLKQAIQEAIRMYKHSEIEVTLERMAT